MNNKPKKEQFSIKHPKFLTCPHCKKQIQSKAYMNSHMEIYHPEIAFTKLVVKKTKGNTIEEGEEDAPK